MEDTEKVRRLKSMLSQVAPGDTIESVRPATIPTDGLESMAESVDEVSNTVDTAVSKLADNREDELTDSEVFALEAIVMPQNRPVVFVRDAGYDTLTDPWLGLNDAAVRNRIAPLLRSIGRVELPNASWVPYGGTGFIVGKDLLMTNRHVAQLFSQGLGEGQGKLRFRSGDAAIDFNRRVDSKAEDRTGWFNVISVEMIHPYWDMSLLRVDGLTDAFPALSLSILKPEDLVDRDVVAVGYPARDDRSNLDLQDRIFERTYNVKRLQPGKIRTREKIRSFESTVNAMTHDSSTLGGNSGSAIIDIQTGQVVGLHFAGIYLKANYAVPTYELARDSHVAKRNLNFNGSVAATNEWDSAWQRVSGTEGVAPVTTSPGPNVQSPTTTPVTGSTNAAQWTIPLQVSISIGQPVRAGAAGSESVAIAPVEAPQMAIPIIFGGLENRKGYNPSFLELDDDEEVPLPRLTDLGRTVAAKLDDGSAELRYHKFSVVIHKGRRLALYTAANVDWRASMRAPDGHKPSRKELTGLTDNQQEQWTTDWRIPEEHQLPDIFYTKDGGAFDKGHLVRRDDVCWGKTFKDIQKANGDTFHTTNCSPQTSAFNQSARGDDNWGDLENLVQKETKAEKAILFSGPVFDEDDPLFEGRGDDGKITIRVPRRFWKIVVVKGSGGPEAYGFVLEQDLSALEFAVPAQWRQYMRSVEEIEGMLNGLAELPWLKPFDRSGSPESVRIAAQLQ